MIFFNIRKVIGYTYTKEPYFQFVTESICKKEKIVIFQSGNDYRWLCRSRLYLIDKYSFLRMRHRNPEDLIDYVNKVLLNEGHTILSKEQSEKYLLLK